MVKHTHPLKPKNPTNPQEIKAKGQAKPLKASLFYITLIIIISIVHILIPQLKFKIMSAIKI